MSTSTARRRAVAATLAALLAAPLFACGAQPTTTAPSADAPAAGTSATGADATDSGKKDDAKNDDATVSSGNSPSNTDAPAFDTWSDDCVDDHGNVTVSALLGLKGWQLQTLLAQRGFSWNAEHRRYEDGEGRVFLAERYFKDGSDETLGEDEIGELDKGAAGSPVAYYLVAAGYLDGKDDESMALLKAVSGVGGVSCEDYRYLDGVLYAIVYNESMNRNFVMAAANDDGTVSIMVCNEDVARTGALTEGGGAPTVMDVWHEYFG